MIETLFLVVLIVALLVGNSLLYFTKPKRNRQNDLKISDLKNSAVQERFFSEEETVKPSNVIYEEVYSFQGKLRAIEEKTRMAHSRLNEVERAVKNINFGLMELNKVLESKSFQTKKEPQKEIPLDKLAQKIQRLEDFKRNARIEIAALGEMIEEIKKEIGAKGEKKQSKREKELSKKINGLEKIIHEVAFHKIKPKVS